MTYNFIYYIGMIELLCRPFIGPTTGSLSARRGLGASIFGEEAKIKMRSFIWPVTYILVQPNLEVTDCLLDISYYRYNYC